MESWILKIQQKEKSKKNYCMKHEILMLIIIYVICLDIYIFDWIEPTLCIYFIFHLFQS